MRDNSYKTAIFRNRPSVPMKWLYSNGYLFGRVLDYGCGRGFDAHYYNLEFYDPHFFPELPCGLFDVITCIYVLNVVKFEEGLDILSSMDKLLTNGGSIYVAVRRDKFLLGENSYGTYQRYVYLDLPLLKETSRFAIYHKKGIK